MTTRHTMKIRDVRQLVEGIMWKTNEDRKQVLDILGDFESMAWHLEREEQRIIGAYRCLQSLKDRMPNSAPVYIRDGITDAINELKSRER